MHRNPNVAVVTPVLNGAPFLEAAIASVRAQTYRNWRYFVLDNASTDETAEIVRRNAAEDPRIELVRNPRTLPLMQNWNAAMRLVPPDADYVKVLHADDWLEPDCFLRLVELAERHPSAVIVSSLMSAGSYVYGQEMPEDRELFRGPEICRAVLLQRVYPFGSPTTLLMRAEEVRARAPIGFYNEANVHADLEICYDLLSRGDFGFVHRVLSHCRKHEGSMTNTFAARYSTHLVEYLGMFWTYGPRYLKPDEYRVRAARDLRCYRKVFARRLLAGRGIGYWRFHKHKLAGYGYRLTAADVLYGLAYELLDTLCDPLNAVRRLPRALNQPSVGRELPRDV